jgi:hypothetical protein
MWARMKWSPHVWSPVERLVRRLHAVPDVFASVQSTLAVFEPRAAGRYFRGTIRDTHRGRDT